MEKHLGIDGPYIYYDQGMVKSITVNAQGVLNRNEWDKNNKDQEAFMCHSATTDLNFNVKLRDKHDVEPYTYDDVDSIFALSDIEGNFKSFTELLITHQVVDSNLNWAFKKGHLVIVGDIFDREEDVLACLWLMYKLEGEATQAQGKVHVLFGNHEIMSLTGDLRYTREKYIQLAKKLEINYSELFNEASELGRWLRTKHTAIIINDDLYVHAGISSNICKNKLSINNINQIIRIYLASVKQKLPLIKEQTELLIGSFGPLWYRGYFLERKRYSKIKKHELKDVLKFYEVQRVIVGHTTFKKVCTKFKHRIIGIDILKPKKPGKKEALFIRDKHYYRAKQNGQKILLFEVT